MAMAALRMVSSGAVLACALLGLMAAPAAAGLDPESNTDGFDPAAESYRINEARRLNAIARQLDLTYLMQWQNPYFPGGPPIEQPIGYESKEVRPGEWIYRPLYPEHVAPAESPSEPLPLPAPAAKVPAQGPQLPAPADAAPGDFILPPPAGKPREF